jgi:hypothetical protein
VLFVEDRPWPAFAQLAAALRRRGVRVLRVIVGSEETGHRPRRRDALVWHLTVVASPGDPAATWEQLAAERIVDVHAVESVLAFDLLRHGPPLAKPAPGLGVAELLDKRNVQRALLGAGINAPEQCAVAACSPHEAAARFGLPLVAKPAVGSGGGGVAILRSGGDVASFVERIDDPRDWLYERFVDGAGITVGGLAAGGRVVVSAPYRRAGNPASLQPARSIECLDDPGLARLADDVRAALGLEGLFAIDVIRDRDGVLWTHDVNARVWSSWAAFRSVGLDFAAYYAAGLSGSDTPTVVAPPAAVSARLAVFPSGWRDLLRSSRPVAGAARLVGWLTDYLRWFGPGYLLVELTSRSRRAGRVHRR